MLLQNGHVSMKEFNLQEGAEESKFHLSTENALLTQNVKEYLLNHPRVLDVHGEQSDSDDDCTMQ